MKLLLTGAFGNVGRAIVEDILAHKKSGAAGGDASATIELVCFDRQSKGTEKVERTLRKKHGLLFEVVWGDITSDADVDKIVKGVDVVIHVAAIIPPGAFNNPTLAMKVNRVASERLIDACNKEANPPRFVFASSYSVIGPRQGLDSEPKIDATYQCTPSDSYAYAKLKVEEYLQANYENYCILRIGAVHMVTNMAGGKNEEGVSRYMYSIPIDQKRHAVDVRDVATAFRNAALLVEFNEKLKRKVFFICGGEDWKIYARTTTDLMLQNHGVKPMSDLAYRKKCDKRECYYAEDWVDTTEAQAVLKFQNHSIKQWQKDYCKSVNKVEYYAAKAFSGVISNYLSKQSPHYKYNKNNTPDPEKDVAFTELCPKGAAVVVVT